MERYLQIKGKSDYEISLKEFLPNKEIEKVIIALHGFGGGKESTAISLLAQKANNENIAVIAFDFPAHGTSKVEADKLTLDNCIKDFESVEEYARKKYNKEIGIFATSFGAYITLLKLSKEKENNYFSIILRSPAICMNEDFKNKILKEDVVKYQKRGYSVLGYERLMNIEYNYYEELEKNNLFDLYNKDYKIFIIQGTNDDMAPIEDTIKFIKNKSNIILHKIEGADHRMKVGNQLNDAIDICMKYILNQK